MTQHDGKYAPDKGGIFNDTCGESLRCEEQRGGVNTKRRDVSCVASYARRRVT